MFAFDHVWPYMGLGAALLLALLLTTDTLRSLGNNAARLVKGLPLKPM